MGFDIPWVESQNTMNRGSKYIKYIEPLIHVIFNPYPWYIDPPTHGILIPPTHGISNPYPWYIDPLSMVF
jgi:hypothetical protein